MKDVFAVLTEDPRITITYIDLHKAEIYFRNGDIDYLIRKDHFSLFTLHSNHLKISFQSCNIDKDRKGIDFFETINLGGVMPSLKAKLFFEENI